MTTHPLWRSIQTTIPDVALTIDHVGSTAILGLNNDTKSGVIYDIYEPLFLADAAHGHDPQPRDSPQSQHRQ